MQKRQQLASSLLRAFWTATTPAQVCLALPQNTACGVTGQIDSHSCPLPSVSYLIKEALAPCACCTGGSKASSKNKSTSSTPTSGSATRQSSTFAALSEAWLIPPEELAICQLPNGKDWLLGSGSFGEPQMTLIGPVAGWCSSYKIRTHRWQPSGVQGWCSEDYEEVFRCHFSSCTPITQL